MSFFRSKAADSAGTPNPVAGRITHALGQGTSQSGNAMKTFLHLGFNQALDGAKVFDGIYAHVAARQTNINTRFAVPGGGAACTDHSAFGQTAPRGLDKDYVDDISGTKGGVMARCSASNTCPKFFLGLSGTEFWQLQGSPVLTDAERLRRPEATGQRPHLLLRRCPARWSGRHGQHQLRAHTQCLPGRHGDPAQRHVPRAVHRP